MLSLSKFSLQLKFFFITFFTVVPFPNLNESKIFITYFFKVTKGNSRLLKFKKFFFSYFLNLLDARLIYKFDAQMLKENHQPEPFKNRLLNKHKINKNHLYYIEERILINNYSYLIKMLNV